MPSLRKRLGLVIRRRRKDAGHSQEAFADLVGIHRTYLGAVERGERNISLDNIERVAAALHISAGRLLLDAEEHGTPTERARADGKGK